MHAIKIYFNEKLTIDDKINKNNNNQIMKIVLYRILLIFFLTKNIIQIFFKSPPIGKKPGKFGKMKKILRICCI